MILESLNATAISALSGTSPIPASSGKTIRHRLNHSGDRALNRAIRAIAGSRTRSCPRTRAYIARELYRQLNQSINLPAGP